MEDYFAGLQGAMHNLAQNIAAQSSNINSQSLDNALLYIEKYTGDPGRFRPWLKSLEKYCRRKSCNTESKINVAYMTTDGPASDFIMRWQETSARPTWEDLKEKLTTHFADVASSDHARSLLRNIKQATDENVTAFGERLYILAKEAFADVDLREEAAKNIIQHEMINSFIDGLKHDAVKFRIMRSEPATFDEALTLALNEQSLRRRFEVRNSHHIAENRYEKRTSHNEGRVEVPMDISHLRKRVCPRCNRSHNGPCRSRINAVNAPQSRPNNVCYTCGAGDHFANRCPQNQHRRQQAGGFAQNQMRVGRSNQNGSRPPRNDQRHFQNNRYAQGRNAQGN